MAQTVRFSASVGSYTRKATGSPYAMAQQARSDFQKIVRNWQRFVNHVENVSADIMVEALKPTFDLSQTYTPKLTGALRESGYIETTHRGKMPRVEIGYGKHGSPEYAAIVHEKVEYRHNPPTRSKFLEAAMNETVGELRNRLIVQYKRITGDA